MRWSAGSRLPRNPDEDAYIFLGQVHYQTKAYEKGLEAINKGVSMAREKGKIPKENWLLLQRVFYYEMKNHKMVAKTLEELVKRYPKKEYWIQLSSTYAEMGQTTQQMEALHLAYTQGLLDRKAELLNLAQLLMQADVPYKAGLIIENGMKNGLIDEDVRNLRLLSQAWALAKEDRRSIDPLKKAAAMSKADGELDIRLAEAYFNLADWQNAADALRKGIDKGNLQREDFANIMLGMAYFNLEKLSESRSAFENAMRDQRSRKTASQWINYIDSEEKRRDQLAQAINP